MNIVILTGRLTRDPDVHIAQSGAKYVSYTLAVDRRDGNTDFIRCKAFGKPAEWCEKFLHKGIKINVEGRIQTGQYTDKEGRTVYTCDIVTQQHEFCEARKPLQAPQQGSVDTFTTEPSTGASGAFQTPSEANGFADEFLPFK